MRAETSMSIAARATRSWKVFLLVTIGIKVSHGEWNLPQCSGTGLKYLQGNALAGSTDCVGPDNKPYPTDLIDRMFSIPSSSYRKGRSSKLMDPLEIQKSLLKHYAAANHGMVSTFSGDFSLREDRSLMSENPSYFSDNQSRRRPASEANKGSISGGCSSPGRLCKTRYNTTAPMYGVSLTSGQAVTIVQKFPDLLQQVIFEVCDTKECDLLHGECVQTYVPYLFLVIPLGPVTLTGQDYVLVENGCVCRPKYAKVEQDTPPTDTLASFSNL